MKIKDKVIVITGAASGIGAAMARRFAREGAKHIVCADRNLADAEIVAKEIGGTAVGTDVSLEHDIAHLIEATELNIGPIDLFVSNAGIAPQGGIEYGDDDWQKIWDINVNAHIRAARLLVPIMLERIRAGGEGYILSTASAAGLLAQIGSAPYSVTKHAAVSFAEWLAITHGKEGLKVSVLCPQGVSTPLLDGVDTSTVDADGLLSADQVAEDVLNAVNEERFLILPHPEVADYMLQKAGNPERWITGMQRLQDKLQGS